MNKLMILTKNADPFGFGKSPRGLANSRALLWSVGPRPDNASTYMSE